MKIGTTTRLTLKPILRTYILYLLYLFSDSSQIHPTQLIIDPIPLVEHDHESVVDALPLDLRDLGVLGRVPHGQQEEELLVLGPLQEGPQRRTAVHRRRRQRREAGVVRGGDEQA